VRPAGELTPQAGGQSRVALDGDEASTALGEMPRDGAAAGTDLDDQVARTDGRATK
jgi:hypothetical protein